MISSGTQIIGTTRSQIDGNSVHWVSLTIRNNEDTKTLFIGNSSVTIENGLPIDKTSTQTFEIPPGESLYMVSDSGTHSVSWLRIEHD
ncbi:MAG: hypothetical protein EBS38_07580 [Actinobacteria bacterium]|nr:hypothetical protein [Actinomycetota bacterium]